MLLMCSWKRTLSSRAGGRLNRVRVKTALLFWYRWRAQLYLHLDVAGANNDWALDISGAQYGLGLALGLELQIGLLGLPVSKLIGLRLEILLGQIGLREVGFVLVVSRKWLRWGEIGGWNGEGSSFLSLRSQERGGGMWRMVSVGKGGRHRWPARFGITCKCQKRKREKHKK